MNYDVFISHASEDKPEVVRPLAELLIKQGVSVWLDENELTIGDSLRRNIDHGLSNSRFGLVILSHAFFSKEWPKKELDSLVAREDGQEKVILPVWHKLTAKEVRAYSPLLADKLSGTTDRGIAQLAEQIVKVLEVDKRRKASPSSSIAKAEERAEAIRNLPPTVPIEKLNRFNPIRDMIIDLLDNAASLADEHVSDVTGVRTGLAELDSLMFGLHKREITLLGARPMAGKTSLALKIALQVAAWEGLPVAVISANMAPQQFTARVTGAFARIPTRRLETGAMTDDEWQRLSSSLEQLGNSNLYFLEMGSSDTSDIIEQITNLAEPFGGTLGLLVVDDINRQASQVVSQGDKTGDLFRAFKAAAKELNCPVLITSDISRIADTRPDPRPTIADILDLNQIERYVDNILFLHRPENALQNTAELILARQRRGPTDTIRVFFDPIMGNFENLAPDNWDIDH